jgi:hypothetical protein
VFVKASKKGLPIAKALAYCTMEVITAVKSFMMQAQMYNFLFNIKTCRSIISRERARESERERDENREKASLFFEANSE